jgi:membrane-bound lytic murein transglycosylase F
MIWPLMALCLSLLGCKEQPKLTHLDQIREQGYLTMVTRPGPATYQSDYGALMGFEFELANRFANFLGVELKVIETASINDLFQVLNKAKADFSGAGLSILESRQQDVRFGPSYLSVSTKLVFKQGNRWARNFSQLNGELWVLANSSHSEQLLAQKEHYPSLSWKETAHHSTLDLVEMMLDEEIDYILLDSNELSLLRRFHPELAIAFTVGDIENLAWAFQKNNDDSLYLEAIKFFGHQQLSGELAKLSEKYYGHISEFDYVDTKRFLKAIELKLPNYKKEFIEAAGDHFDWRLLAAVSYQESHWNPRARSPTGVRGMMMLTLPTAKQMGVTNRLDPIQSIVGGAKYLYKNHNRIHERIQEPDRTWFALAAYNIGYGHLEDARKIAVQLGKNPDQWSEIKEVLPLLRKKKYYKATRYGYARGEEPVNYVTNIRRYYETLVWLDEQQQIKIQEELMIAAQEKEKSATSTMEGQLDSAVQKLTEHENN